MKQNIAQFHVKTLACTMKLQNIGLWLSLKLNDTFYKLHRKQIGRKIKDAYEKLQLDHSIKSVLNGERVLIDLLLVTVKFVLTSQAAAVHYALIAKWYEL